MICWNEEKGLYECDKCQELFEASVPAGACLVMACPTCLEKEVVNDMG